MQYNEGTDLRDNEQDFIDAISPILGSCIKYYILNPQKLSIDKIEYKKLSGKDSAEITLSNGEIVEFYALYRRAMNEFYSITGIQQGNLYEPVFKEGYEVDRKGFYSDDMKKKLVRIKDVNIFIRTNDGSVVQTKLSEPKNIDNAFSRVILLEENDNANTCIKCSDLLRVMNRYPNISIDISRGGLTYKNDSLIMKLFFLGENEIQEALSSGFISF